MFKTGEDDVVIVVSHESGARRDHGVGIIEVQPATSIVLELEEVTRAITVVG